MVIEEPHALLVMMAEAQIQLVNITRAKYEYL